MRDISKIDSCGLVNVTIGQKTEVKELEKGKDGLPQFSVTIVPGRTTVDELKAQLWQLGIKRFMESGLLDSISGANKIYDENEIIFLDNYLDKEVVLLYLGNSGVTVDKHTFLNLSMEKIQNRKYINTLIELDNAGIYVEDLFMKHLVIDLAEDRHYINALKDLQRYGIRVDFVTVMGLPAIKVKDPVFIKALKELRESGIVVDNSVMDYLTPEQAHNKVLIGALKELQKSGIPVDIGIINILTYAKSKDRKYIEALKKMQGSGIKVDQYVIKYLTPEKAKDRVYIEGLMALYQAGVKIDGSFIDALSVPKIRNREYYDLLVKYKGDFNKAISGYMSYVMKDGASKSLHYAKDNTSLSVTKALFLVRRMDRMHGASYEARSQLINGLSAGELYMLIVLADDEVYSDTFRTIFRQMIYRMKADKLDAYTLIEQCDPSFRDYQKVLTKCAIYGCFGELIQTNSDDQNRERLLKRFMEEPIQSANKVQDAVRIAEVMSYEGNADMLGSLEEYLVDAYNMTKRKEDRDSQRLYKIIGSIYYANKGKDNIQNKSCIRTIEAFAKEYPLTPALTINQNELINHNNEIIEQQYFYNDEDGRASFDAFVARYLKDPSWSIVSVTMANVSTFVAASKISNGVKLYIYANKPSKGDAGVQDIHKAFNLLGLRPTIVAHRGHGQHLGKTIDKLSPSARIVFLGSCGGANHTNKVLERAPRAQVIASKKKGTYTVNDPLLKNINEAAFSPMLDWRKIWEKTRGQIGDNEDLQNYVKPYENIAAQVFQLYASTRSVKYRVRIE